MPSNAEVARCTPLVNATRNSNEKNATVRATRTAVPPGGHPMTGRELRAQLRAQQACNNPSDWCNVETKRVASDATDSPHYRWRISYANGCGIEMCATPELNRQEVEARYPGGQVESLPDAPRGPDSCQ